MIRIEVPAGKFEQWGHETLIGARYLKLLKSAGIPAIGEFCLRGVKTGSLWITNRDKDGQVFQYSRCNLNETEPSTPFRRVKEIDGATVYLSGPELQEFEDDEL